MAFYGHHWGFRWTRVDKETGKIGVQETRGCFSVTFENWQRPGLGVRSGDGERVVSSAQ